MSHFLFLLCTLIWGSTWIAITFQLGNVPIEVSIFYRFAISALILLAFCLYKKIPLKLTPQNHRWVALQGICLFSINYVLTYTAETHISSGLVALTFSTILFFNIAGGRLFFKTHIPKEVILGAALGAIGLTTIFYKEVANFGQALKSGQNGALGVAVGIIATAFASAGNLLFVRNQKAGVSVWAANTWGMIYGSILNLTFCMALQSSFSVPLTFSYLGSLGYLAVFGTVIAFMAYLTLISRMGPERASYTAVTIPIVALTISTLFENFHWSLATWSGVGLCLIGNWFALQGKKKLTQKPACRAVPATPTLPPTPTNPNLRQIRKKAV